MCRPPNFLAMCLNSNLKLKPEDLFLVYKKLFLAIWYLQFFWRCVYLVIRQGCVFGDVTHPLSILLITWLKLMWQKLWQMSPLTFATPAINDLQFLKRTHEKDGHTVTRMPSICHDLESRPFFLWPNLPKLFCLPAVFQFRLWRPRRPPHGSSRRTLGGGGEAGGAPREGKVRNIAI